MPQLNFVKQGQGPLVVLSHALGCDLTMWGRRGAAAGAPLHRAAL
jgi:3-oxoadipate enol-lactonase